MLHELLNALEETLFMVFASGLLTILLGGCLGIVLATTHHIRLFHLPFMYHVLNFSLKITLSIPYLALMVISIPLIKMMTKMAITPITALIPLTLAALPYFAKWTEKSLTTLPSGLLETGQSMGASSMQIIWKVLLPEAMPDIIQGITKTLVILLGYSVICGALGGGGLGQFIIKNGMNTPQIKYVIAATLILIMLTQVIQLCGKYIVYGSIKK